MNSESEPALTLVVPTYDERPNMAPLMHQLSRLRASWDVPFEVLFVDDASPDGTADCAEALAGTHGLSARVLRRKPPRSLGLSIGDGLNQARGDLVCVLDADLSHPPSLLPELMRRLNGFDAVVASRYQEGGSAVGWPLHRRLISRVATRIARPSLMTPCSDPLSGFFLVRRSALAGVRITGMGNKALCEILSQKALTIYEVPYEFRNRTRGKSKLTFRGVLEYVRLAARMRSANADLSAGTEHIDVKTESPKRS